jgi:UDPglucose 6-dehydrogenase
MKIAIIGTGYVGLVTGTCFADCGNDVIGIDKDQRKVEMLKKGEIPIYEPGLKELVHRNQREGRLQFTTDLPTGIANAEVIFIAVGTPQGPDGAADLSTVYAVTDALAAAITGHKIVVIKSTVPVGTNRQVYERLKAKCKHPVDVCSNPEFLKEGAAIDDCSKPDRVVVGVRRPEVAQVLQELYAPFLRTERPFLAMTPESAEMTKYVANAMLATKISFINEMANLCEKVGADINDVRRGIGHDVRIGFQFLFPGAGYGGSCFEADETVFTLDERGVRARAICDVFSEARVLVPLSGSQAGQDESGPELRAPIPGLRVLALDLETGKPCLARIHVLTRRPYFGVMVTLTTSMGRRLRVTADHPIVLAEDEGYRKVLAAEVRPGDRIAALSELPALREAGPLDLIELLAGTPLEQDVYVAPTDNSFTDQYPHFAPHISPQELRCPEEIRNNNRMSLMLYRRLQAAGVLDVPAERLQLYTAKGAATRINALVPVDADLARLCGYYLAEGFISRDVGRAGAVRHRVGFCFHAEEAEYIADVRRILTRWGLKYIERTGTNANTTVVSSRIFAWLLRDVLACGTRSEDKALPTFAFHVGADLREELLRGAFSGDGSVTELQRGRNFMLEYATVSRRLADGLALLLQSLEIVPSVRPRWMNKSKRPAYLVRVTGREQLAKLADVFGGKHRERIAALLAGYERTIRQRGFERCGPVAALTVHEVSFERTEQPVYSLETETGTLVGSSGLVLHNCFPKDVRALVAVAGQQSQQVPLMNAVDLVNEKQKQVLPQKVKQHFGDSLKGRTVALWGLAFKPRTDDIREAPALVLIDFLLSQGVHVRVHDPEAIPNVRAQYGNKLSYSDKPYGALEGADALVIVTEWTEFRNPDFEVMRRLMKEKTIFDGRNLYDPKTIAGLGFTYYSIGRKTVQGAK